MCWTLQRSEHKIHKLKKKYPKRGFMFFCTIWYINAMVPIWLSTKAANIDIQTFSQHLHLHSFYLISELSIILTCYTFEDNNLKQNDNIDLSYLYKRTRPWKHTQIHIPFRTSEYLRPQLPSKTFSSSLESYPWGNINFKIWQPDNAIYRISNDEDWKKMRYLRIVYRENLLYMEYNVVMMDGGRGDIVELPHSLLLCLWEKHQMASLLHIPRTLRYPSAEHSCIELHLWTTYTSFVFHKYS
jgi:hypothetical protein